ncbi:MAG: hypothetical protein WC654_05280 [Patescibacteria group bacterium]
MPYLPWILGVAAALLCAIGYIIYNVQSKKNDSKPNAVSWFIWAIMAVLNTSSFAVVTDIPHALQYMVGTFAAITTFLLALYWRRFNWPEPIEWFVLVFCLIVMGLWGSLNDASLANATILVPFLISFWPTFDGARRNPHKETPLAWSVWTAAFAVSLLNNVATWNENWMSVINPLVLLVCHGSIAMLSRQVRKLRFASTS